MAIEIERWNLKALTRLIVKWQKFWMASSDIANNLKIQSPKWQGLKYILARTSHTKLYNLFTGFFLLLENNLNWQIFCSKFCLCSAECAFLLKFLNDLLFFLWWNLTCLTSISRSLLTKCSLIFYLFFVINLSKVITSFIPVPFTPILYENI